MPKQRQDDEGRAVPLRLPALVPHEQHEQYGRGRERRPGPGRPARRGSADERVEEQREGCRHEHNPDQIELETRRRARFRYQQPRQRQSDRTKRQIDEKHRPPVEPQHVGAHQQAAEQLAGDHAESDGDAVQRVGATLLASRERHLNERQSLRHHDGRERSL